MNKIQDNIELINNAIKDKIEIRDLQDFYVNSTLSNINEIVERKKQDVVEKMKTYIENNRQSWFDKHGLEHFSINNNNIVINKYFFSSLNPLHHSQPTYTAEVLGIMFELYEDICMEVNQKIGDYVPTLSNFCKFVGITTSTFNHYKNSNDPSMRIIAEKIIDYCYDSTVTLSQNGKIKETISKYRMKSELEKAEKENPKEIIIEDNYRDMNEIKKRLGSLNNYNNKKLVGTKINE